MSADHRLETRWRDAALEGAISGSRPVRVNIRVLGCPVACRRITALPVIYCRIRIVGINTSIPIRTDKVRHCHAGGMLQQLLAVDNQWIEGKFGG
jgi:hypothetical protein